MLEREVLRDEGAECSASIGDVVKVGDAGLLFGALSLLPKSRVGISVDYNQLSMTPNHQRNKNNVPPSIWSVSALYLT